MLPPEVAKRARELWERGLFWEVHEELEPHWQRATGTERELLQGVIQLAAALHKARTNKEAAERILRRALAHLKRAGVEGGMEERFLAAVRGEGEAPGFPL